MVEAPYAIIEVSSLEAYVEIRMAIEARVRMLDDMQGVGPVWPNGERLLRHAKEALADAARATADRL